MAYYFSEPSRTFGEYLLVPGYSSSACVPNAVSLRTPLVKYRKGEEECPLSMNIPMVSAIMQSVSGEKLAIALAKQGGISFIYGSQTVQEEADMVRRVKAYKKGFVTSDSNLPPEATLADVLDLKTRTGHSTVAITEDGSAHGKLLGIVASRDYRLSRMSTDLKVTEFMTPLDKLITAPATTSLHDCNDIIWDNKINSLPLIDEEGHLQYMVFRKDYDSHKENVNELLDKNKSYVVGAGINTRDYAERVPALVEAGVDVLCIDSSEGFCEWQSRTIDWIRAHYGDGVKVGDFVEIKNSKIGDGTKVAHLTYVGDSDVGRNVNFGCGTVTVNYDRVKKFRTTIEDDAFIGCNTNLVAPVTVGRGAYTGAGSTITDIVPSMALTVTRARQTNKRDWAARHKLKNK